MPSSPPNTSPALETIKIPGLSYCPDFISPVEENDLIKTIDSQPWRSDLKRRVQHYGYRYDYKARLISPDLYIGHLPNWLRIYTNKFVQSGIFSKEPDQVIVNEYQPGQGIAPHIDCIPCFGDIISSLSLGSTCLMDFADTQSNDKMTMPLAPRSLLVLSEEARTRWTHGIASRKSDIVNGHKILRERRVSLTFRNILLR
jgi:alkylated DNA repair dioxygenase AlkB